MNVASPHSAITATHCLVGVGYTDTIEIIFKAWKSHLRYGELNQRNERMVRLSILTKLLYWILLKIHI